jgi:serine/threonine-protein kinase
MSELITASVMDLSTFQFPATPLASSSTKYELWKAQDSATGEFYAVKTYFVTKQNGSAVPRAQQLKNINYFFREVAGLLLSAHPTVVPIVGWNIQLDVTPPRFSIVMKYLRNDPIQFSNDRGLALTATDRQIILYGVAHGLETLHARRQVHQDVMPANILFDKHCYPRLGNIALPTYAVLPQERRVVAECTKYIAPELLNGARPSLTMDQFSYAMLLYEFLEDKEAVPLLGAGEKPADAITAAPAPRSLRRARSSGRCSSRCGTRTRRSGWR